MSTRLATRCVRQHTNVAPTLKRPEVSRQIRSTQQWQSCGNFWSSTATAKPAPTRQHQPNAHNESTSRFLKAAAFVSCANFSLLLLSNTDATAAAETSSESGMLSIDNSTADESPSDCYLPWIQESKSSKAQCTVCENEKCADAPFDPAKSPFYEIKISSASSTGVITARDQAQSKQQSPILHNTIIVLPNLISENECNKIAKETDRILQENHENNVYGVKTEKWAMYHRFDNESKVIMNRVLGRQILQFLDDRMPHISKKILEGGINNGRLSFLTVQREIDVEPSDRDNMKIYWDFPVVIRYSAGNQLAPHEDMRHLTIVIPLNPLECTPLEGGGTRFWVEGMSPDDAAADEGGGVSVKPPAGSGILFNGDITHSGNPVSSGTRYVLMTSIAFDEDDNDGDNDDEGDLD